MPKVNPVKPYHLRQVIVQLVQKKWPAWKIYCKRHGKDPLDLEYVRTFIENK